MTVETTIADAVAARLVPEVARIVRTELAAQIAALHAPAAQEPELLSVREFAKRAGISPCTTRRRIADNSLPSVRIGGSIRIPASALKPPDPGTVASLARAARAGS
ncbi:MAG: excisionase family DNA-binding protein [Polyangia bacterium]